MVGSAIAQTYGQDFSDILTVGFPALPPLPLLLEPVSNAVDF